jgi:sortase A
MRKIVAALLNICGIALLATAALLAWKSYNPDTPAIPSDITVVNESRPAPPTPAARAPVTSEAPAPLLLPETKLPAATAPAALPASHPAESRAEDVPSAVERKSNAGNLEAERAKSFPPPAHSVPTRIALPTIDVDSSIVEVGWKTTVQDGQAVSEWEVADYAVGFHKTTALPGAPGNTVMSGHNNINGEVFKYLILVKVGDDIFVYADNNIYRFVVEQKLLLKERDMPLDVRLQNAQWIAPTDDVRLTLVSCWPYTSNTHRVIVVAKPAG